MKKTEQDWLKRGRESWFPRREREGERQTDRQTDRHRERETNRQTDRQTNRQTDRQTERRAGRKISEIDEDIKILCFQHKNSLPQASLLALNSILMELHQLKEKKNTNI